MAITKQYLDYEGLTAYNTKVKAKLDTKVEKVTGKGLSDENYTSAEKTKLEGLKNYVLPAAATATLGGVIVETTEDPVPAKTAIKADATGKAFVDWADAPAASATVAGLAKVGTGLKVSDSGAIEVDPSTAPAHEVNWSDIQGKPDVAVKGDLASVYKFKGSVANYAALPTEGLEVGFVYNVEDTGMNYAWTGTEWDALGQAFSITAISNEQIDALFTSDT